MDTNRASMSDIALIHCENGRHVLSGYRIVSVGGGSCFRLILLAGMFEDP